MEPTPDSWLEDIIRREYWLNVCQNDIDAVLVPVNAETLNVLEKSALRSGHRHPGASGFWAWLPTAVIAVLGDDSVHLAVQAAKCDFDGILSQPYESDTVSRQLSLAIHRSDNRYALHRRYHKMHHLFHRINQDRRHLRDKVDLLCHDLVHSNAHLTNTLQEMCRAHDFLGKITGEFDQKYMLYKALRIIKQRFADSSALIFLCDSNDFEAHICGVWDELEHDPETLETGLKTSVITETILSRQSRSLANVAQAESLSPGEKAILAGLSILTHPIILEDELMGVLVIYRDDKTPFAAADAATARTYLYPLARALDNLRRLKAIL